MTVTQTSCDVRPIIHTKLLGVVTQRILLCLLTLLWALPAQADFRWTGTLALNSGNQLMLHEDWKQFNQQSFQAISVNFRTKEAPIDVVIYLQQSMISDEVSSGNGRTLTKIDGRLQQFDTGIRKVIPSWSSLFFFVEGGLGVVQQEINLSSNNTANLPESDQHPQYWAGFGVFWRAFDRVDLGLSTRHAASSQGNAENATSGLLLGYRW